MAKSILSEAASVRTPPPLIAALFSAIALRGAPRRGDVDTDRRIGLRPDNLGEVAGVASALRRARAGLDEVVLAIVGSLRRRIFGARLGLARALRRRLGAGVSAWRRGARRSGRRPELLVDVVGGKLALDVRETGSQRLQNALQIGKTRLRALVRARVFSFQFGQMRVERGVDRGRGLERGRAFRLVGLPQLFDELPHDWARFFGPRGLRRQRVDPTADRVDLPGDGSQVDLGGVPIVKPARDLVGDLFKNLALDRLGGARLQLGLERAQQGFDRIEVDRRRDRVESRAELVENRVQLPRADLRVSEVVKLVADFGEYRLQRLGVGVGAAGGGKLGVEIVQEPFDWAGVDGRRRKRLKRLADAIDASRQVVERARIERCGSGRPSDFLIEPRRDLLQTLFDRDKRRRRSGALDLSAGFREKRGHLCGLGMGSGARAEPFDAISEFPDLALQPFKRRCAQRCRSEEIAHFFRLPPDAFKRFGLYRRRREAVDLVPDRPNLAFEPGGRRLRVMRP